VVSVKETVSLYITIIDRFIVPSVSLKTAASIWTHIEFLSHKLTLNIIRLQEYNAY